MERVPLFTREMQGASLKLETLHLHTQTSQCETPININIATECESTPPTPATQVQKNSQHGDSKPATINAPPAWGCGRSQQADFNDRGTTYRSHKSYEMNTPAEHSTARILWPSYSDQSRTSEVETIELAAAVPKKCFRRAQEGGRSCRKGEPRSGDTTEGWLRRLGCRCCTTGRSKGDATTSNLETCARSVD